MLTVQILTLTFSICAVIAFVQIRQKGGTIHFIYRWAFPMGSFVWEDLFIFSLYGLFASLVTLISQQLRLGLLFLIIFWLVRSVGETLYFFFQQFLEPQHSPHYLDDLHFKILRRLFGPLNKQQCYIIMQIFFQVITMLAIVCLILTILNWGMLP